MIESLIKHHCISDFVSCAKSNLPCDGPRKLCGIDISENRIGFKIYIGLDTVPEPSILSNFYEPEIINEFFKWIKFLDKTRIFCLVLAAKVDNVGFCRKYFHIKFGEEFKEVMFPEQFLFLRLLKINIHSLLKGISYEIKPDNSFYKKFYIYIQDPLEIKKVLNYKKMANGLDIDEIEELEIYATENCFKINIVNKMENSIVKQDIWKTIPSNLKPHLEECAQILDCPPAYTGVTSSGVLSVYFSLTKKTNNILNL